MAQTKSRKRTQTIKLALPPITKEDRETKNLDGSKGEKCNNCGGLGWTVMLKGGRLECKDCGGTGVVKIPVEEQLAAMQEQIDEMKSWISQMIQHMVAEGIIKNVPKNVMEIIKKRYE